MPSHNITLSVSAAGQTVQKNVVVTDTQSKEIDVTLSASTTNHEEDFDLTANKTSSLCVQNTGGDLTIKTNSTGSPDNTVVMADGDVLLWSSVAAIGVNPFAAATVTKFYLTTTAGTRLRLFSIVNNTNG